MTRNSETLDSFIKYCQENPELRFWQALRNWSKFDFIMGWDGDRTKPVEGVFDTDKASELGMVDTFYFEGKDE